MLIYSNFFYCFYYTILAAIHSHHRFYFWDSLYFVLIGEGMFDPSQVYTFKLLGLFSPDPDSPLRELGEFHQHPHFWVMFLGSQIDCSTGSSPVKWINVGQFQVFVGSHLNVVMHMEKNIHALSEQDLTFQNITATGIRGSLECTVAKTLWYKKKLEKMKKLVQINQYNEYYSLSEQIQTKLYSK